MLHSLIENWSVHLVIKTNNHVIGIVENRFLVDKYSIFISTGEIAVIFHHH